MILYKTVLIDPPWSYRNKKTGGNMISGAATKYPTMDIWDLLQLPIKNVVDKNSVMWLWATTPMLPDALELISYWGYQFKTIVYWRKIMSLGMGYWFRGQVELLLLGIQGKIKAFHCQKPNFIQSKAQKHSQKPEDSYKLIELVSPEPRLELFACRERKGWTTIGYDIGTDVKEFLFKGHE